MEQYEKLTDEQLIEKLHSGDRDVTDYLMEKYKKLFHCPEAFIKMGERLTVIPMPEPQVKKSTKERGEAR